MLELSDHLKASLPREGTFDAILRLDGEVFRHHKHRRTFRTSIGDRPYFIKIHGPTAWREILKNALRFRWPVLTARTEWEAIRRLDQLGVPTTRAAGVGVRGRFPDRLESFIITEALQNMIHLSDLPPRLAELPAPQRLALRRRLIDQLGRIARALHTNGLNHRDFYLCHFMLEDRKWDQWKLGDDLRLHVIDLHRVQIRQRTPQRWAIKDISGLLFSALDASLTDRDCVRFLRAYWGDSWRERWKRSRWWRWRVVRRAVNLYRAEHGKQPRLPAGLASFA